MAATFLFYQKKLKEAPHINTTNDQSTTMLRRSARIAAKNAPSTPVRPTRAVREVPPAPIKEKPTTSAAPLRSSYDAPAIVAARAAAAALYPVGSKEYYDELDKSPAIQEDRAAFFNRFSGSISKGW